MSEQPDSPQAEHSFVDGGPTSEIVRKLGIARPDRPRRLFRAGLVLLVTWLPLALLSWWAGHAVGDRVAIPFFSDPEVHARFLVVVPLLILAEVVVSASLSMQSRHLRELGIVPEKELPRFQLARDQAIGLRNSLPAEVGIIVFALMLSLVTRLSLGMSEGRDSWERTPPRVATSVEVSIEGADVAAEIREPSRITAAGWWLIVISLPVLFFCLLRWVFVFLVWSLFLFKVSRLELELTPTHPDRAGGLGFIGWGLASFSTVLMAVSSVMSAAFASLILNYGSSLDELKFHVILFVVIALLILHLPLLAFAGKLMRCRFDGLLEIGALAWRHDRAFDEKWIKNRADLQHEKLLGSPDIQSLADVGTCYEHVDRMLPIPFDVKAFAVLVLSALIPMIPLLGTAIPLDEIMKKLGELLF